MIVDFFKKINDITKRDARYKADAYEFVMEALWFTQKKLRRNGHVTGKELLEGIRDFGLEQFGPMTETVFQNWGITKTEDFGEIVFNMVEHGLMNKTESDSRQDFKNVYNFKEAFDSRKLFGIEKDK